MIEDPVILLWLEWYLDGALGGGTIVASRTFVNPPLGQRHIFVRLVNEFPQMAVEIMRELARRLEKTTAQLQKAVSKENGA